MLTEAHSNHPYLCSIKCRGSSLSAFLRKTFSASDMENTCLSSTRLLSSCETRHGSFISHTYQTPDDKCPVICSIREQHQVNVVVLASISLEALVKEQAAICTSNQERHCRFILYPMVHISQSFIFFTNRHRGYYYEGLLFFLNL